MLRAPPVSDAVLCSNNESSITLFSVSLIYTAPPKIAEL